MDVNVLCDNYPESFCLLCCFSVMVVSNMCFCGMQSKKGKISSKVNLYDSFPSGY